MSVAENYRLKQYILPNKKILEINALIVDELLSYRQNNDENESGGILIGLTSKKGNILIKKITTPFENDTRHHLIYKRKSIEHLKILKREYIISNGIMTYQGNWHTHPFPQALPSVIDTNSWNESLEEEISLSGYLIFIIISQKEIGVWARKLNTKKIIKLNERGKYECSNK